MPVAFHRPLLCLAPLALAVGVLGSFAATSTAPAGSIELGAGDGALEEAMERMNVSMKALLKGVTAENRDASLEHVAKLQAAVLSAKSETPHSAEKIAEAGRAAFVADFRKTLVRVLATSCELETALLDGKYDDANAVVKSKLAALKKDGHDKFNPDEE